MRGYGCLKIKLYLKSDKAETSAESLNQYNLDTGFYTVLKQFAHLCGFYNLSFATIKSFWPYAVYNCGANPIS